ncbi:hypothetical protein WJX72_000604 [[Myrmecia] bisecta]|uniref:Uncharacterized protein n=1 Tax=[Myrmecia] bisecta TaxID=41462 RepID=A0AAW1Q6F8_9CHLO
MMCMYLGNFMARCVGVPGVWLRSPGVTPPPSPAEQHPLTRTADQLAVLRRLCELWADPLVRSSCGKAIVRPISAICRLFLGDGGVTPPGEPEWDILMTTPGFWAGLADSGAYVGGIYRHMHTFVTSLPAARWERVHGDQLLVGVLRGHASCLERAPILDEHDQPWPMEEYERVVQSMDCLLSTPQRRFYVLAQLCTVSRFVGWLATQAGLARLQRRGFALKPGVSDRDCREPLSVHARVWLNRKLPGRFA